ncbi:MAG: hypothetical protein ACT6QS_02545 [Flavobacteriales bacterium]
MRHFYLFRNTLIVSALIFAGSSFLPSCAKQKTENAAWLRVDSIHFTTTEATQGTARQDLRDLWVYINENLQGTYQVPFKVPVIMDGTHNVILAPGILLNGMTGSRPLYTAVKPYYGSMTFVPGDTLVYNPSFEYDTTVTFAYLENFEQGSLSMYKTVYSTGDFTSVSGGNDPYEGNNCGLLSLNSGDASAYAEAATIDPYIFPKDGRGIFVEMHYKCNTDFIVKIRGVATDGSTYDFDIGGVYSSENKWKKIYFTLTPRVVEFSLGNKFHLMYRINRNTDVGDQRLYVDNIKILY